MKTSYYFDVTSYGGQLKTKGMSKQTKQNLKTTLVVMVFLIGLLYGALLLKEDDALLDQFSLMQQTTLTQRVEAGFVELFWQSLVSNCLFLTLCLCFGFWAVGQPFALFLLLAKGMGLGGMIGSFYLAHGAQGIFYAMLLILPGAVCGVLALLYSAREAIELSNLLFCRLFLAGQDWQPQMMRVYFIKQGILLLFVLLSALLDGATAVIAQNWIVA